MINLTKEELFYLMHLLNHCNDSMSQSLINKLQLMTKDDDIVMVRGEPRQLSEFD
jgi:hypothetical protein